MTEHRLSGYESKFVSTFSRYLICPRDLSASAVEQVAALFEPFLKKLALLFDMRNAENKPIWGSGLDGLIEGMNLTAADLRNTDNAYWTSQSVEGAVFTPDYQSTLFPAVHPDSFCIQTGGRVGVSPEILHSKNPSLLSELTEPKSASAVSLSEVDHSRSA